MFSWICFVSKCPASDSLDSLANWFLHYLFVATVWHQILLQLNVPGVFLSMLWGFLAEWWGENVSRPLHSLSLLLPGLVCWELWKARYSLLFNDQ